MAKATKPRKILKREIAKKLATEFDDLKTNVGDKKFEKNIRKASKNLTAGYKEVKAKPKPAAKKKAKTDSA